MHGYNPSMDVRRPEVRARLEMDVNELVGPEVANVWYFANDCSSYCRWMLVNGGTRTFKHPEGVSPTQHEKDSNLVNNWTAKQLCSLSDHGKLFLLENQAPDGQYPKCWDMPAMQQAIEYTKAVIIPGSMCEHGLAPPDKPSARHQKHYWLLVHPDLAPFAATLWRVCTNTHEHVLLAGHVPGTSQRRSQLAGVYTPVYANRVLDAVEAAYHGTLPSPPKPTLLPGGGERCRTRKRPARRRGRTALGRRRGRTAPDRKWRRRGGQGG